VLITFYIGLLIPKQNKTVSLEDIKEPEPENITHENDEPAQNINADYPCSSPTPKEIYADIRNQPSLLQQSYAQNYTGLKVRWSGICHDFIDNGDGTVDIGLAPPLDSDVFFFRASHKNNPILRTLKDGSAKIEVSGTIDTFSATSVIELKDTEIISLTLLNT